MKSAILYLGLLCLIVLSCKKIPEPSSYPFYIVKDNFDTTKVIAQSQQKNIFLMIHADWCNSCNVFKTNVLNDAEIKDLLENKIVVSLIDGDKPYGQLYYNQYNAQGFPTLLVLDAEGKELKRNKGALSMNEFQSWIKDYLK